MEWISVKDRLPDKDDNYLIFTINDNIEICWIDKESQYFELVVGCKVVENDYFTHWQSLPQPPKD